MLALACGDDDSTPAEDAGPRADAEVSMEDAGRDDAGETPEDAGSEGDAGPVGVDAGPLDCTPGQTVPELAFEPVAEDYGFRGPLFVTAAPGDPDTLYVVERHGEIRVVRDGSVLEEPFFEVSGPFRSGGETGLLGLAFHPGYAENGRFFVYFTPASPGRNSVAEYRRSDEDPYRAEEDEVARLVDVVDNEGNHNGGMIAFGPDGMLYVGIGDEGGGYDRHGENGHGLNRETLFGSMLRLDVDRPEAEYAAEDNPFDEGLPQIWSYGLRNPWRFSFDRVTGDLYIGDVGQARWEEIDFLPAGVGGANFGWRAYEAFEVSDEDSVFLVPEHTEPVVAIRHGTDEHIPGACSVTGGYVYRGSAIPGLQGWYLYGDNCSLDVAAFRMCEGEPVDVQRVPSLRAGGDGTGNGLASFGEDGHGELYVTYIASRDVRKIVAAE